MEGAKKGHRRTRSVVPNLPAILGGGKAKEKKQEVVEGDQVCFLVIFVSFYLFLIILI